VNKNVIFCKYVNVVDLNEEKDHHHCHLSDILKIIDNELITEKAKQITTDFFNYRNN